MQCRELMSQFRYINFHWIRRTLNSEANDLAQMASGYREAADGVDEGAVPGSAPATSRLFVLPVAASRWVSTDNTFWHAWWDLHWSHHVSQTTTLGASPPLILGFHPSK